LLAENNWDWITSRLRYFLAAFLAAFLATFFAAFLGAALDAFFFTAFLAGADEADAAGDALDALRVLFPKMPSQPVEYFSFVPTRVIVTDSPLYKTDIQPMINAQKMLSVPKLSDVRTSGQDVFQRS
jgi:hypothetical protein